MHIANILVFHHLENGRELCKLVGDGIAKLHDGGLIHGDLTTSNIIVSRVEGSDIQKVTFIDFGLSQNSTLSEDKAVDLYVLERAFLSLHSEIEGLVKFLYYLVNILT